MNETERPPDDFVNAFETAFARLQVLIEEACAGDGDWPRRVAAAIRSSLEFAATDPAAVRVLAVESLARGTEGIGRHERLIGYLAELLTPGRRQQPHGASLPDITERAMASGVTMLVAQRLDQNREAELPAMASEVIQFVLTPYLDSDAAAEVASGGESRPR